MKKPVRAIDMRRTATVLDFAVRAGERIGAHSCPEYVAYLSSPFLCLRMDE